MNYETAFGKLVKIGQESIFKYWETLNSAQKQHLLSQIENLNLEVLEQQKKLLQKDPNSFFSELDSFSDYELSGNADDFRLGKQLLSEGKAGCLLVAGGQGTRLNFAAPKGLFPITPIKHKSLFQFFAEKTAAASKQVGKLLPLAIMIAPSNEQAIKDFFNENHLFGLQPSQLFFFCQGQLPFLDANGNLFVETPEKIAYGPDGNGYALHNFFAQGIWKQWHEQGISMVNFVLIDNPLADPFDAELLGFHHRKKDDITIKCVMRRDIEEKVGLIVKKDKKTEVIEYSEVSNAERIAKDAEGNLKHCCANISLFCFDMDFIKHIAKTTLPLHRALKTAPNGQKAWKFETFIFDLLPLAKSVHALLYPREKCFAPLKNKTGKDSPATVQKALLDQAREIISEITGKPAPKHDFELTAAFYYPTDTLLQSWKGVSPPERSYIESTCPCP